MVNVLHFLKLAMCQNISNVFQIFKITFIIAVKESYSGHQVHKNGISADFKLTFLKEAFDSEFFLKIEPFGPLLFVEDFEVAKVKIFTE